MSHRLTSPRLHSPAPVPVLQSLLGAVAAPQPGPLGQYELQLGSGSSSDQGPDQGQGVLVEVGLKLYKFYWESINLSYWLYFIDLINR